MEEPVTLITFAGNGHLSPFDRRPAAVGSLFETLIKDEKYKFTGSLHRASRPGGNCPGVGRRAPSLSEA